MAVDFDKLRGIFFQDAEEHLDTVNTALGQLSTEVDNTETIGSLFRCIHSLKGDSGALGFDSIQSVLHRFESHLDLVRDGRAALTEHSIDVFGVIVDCVDQLVLAEREGKPSPPGAEAALTLLEDLTRATATDAAPAPAPAAAEEPEDEDAGFGLFDDEEAGDSSLAEASESAGQKSAPDGPYFGEFLVSREKLSDEQVHAALDFQRSQQPLLGKLLIQAGTMGLSDATRVLLHQQETGERFGDAAVTLGILTKDDLYDAVTEQRWLRPSLRESVVELGYLDAESVAKVYEAFEEEFPNAPKDDGRPLEAPAPVEQAPTEGAAPAADFDCDPQLLAEFINDSDEHLAAAEEQLLVIESDPKNAEALNAIYRAFHTVKGLSSFLGLEATRNLAHQSESMLNLAREGTITLTGDALEVSLASVDGLKRQVRFAEQWLTNRGSLPIDEQLTPLLAAIDAVSRGTKPCPIAPSVAESEAEPAPPAAPTASAPAAQKATPVQVKETIKVDRDRLDKLINVIGELVIGHAMVEQEIADWNAGSARDSVALSQLDKTVRDLQELSLSLRMVPVGSVFHKMARIVRDLGRKLDKDIKFSTEGDDTELDKTVVDQIGDPLLHMVRNAADHGIETPEDRIAAGKPAQGSVTLRAYHQGGNIYLEIEDDGKGLDPAIIRGKAIEKGIITESDQLTDQEIYNLIFAPGFSTAKQVTDVSGRGVGMDVVRRNVEALQGSVSVTSEKGKGSTVIIRLPLTLAILDGLSIRVGDQVFIVPILSVVESFSPAPGEVKRVAGKGEVVVVRGEVVPLLRVDALLGVNRAEGGEGLTKLVVIVEDRGKKYALLVDELVGQSQVVIKNLETNYQKVDGLAGATILGDGTIAMILDVFGLVSLSSTPAIADRVDAAAIDNRSHDSASAQSTSRRETQNA